MKAIDIANWFINKANSEKLDNDVSEGISNLKLQKMLYFAQAAHLAVNGNKPLFDDEIVAWKLGPVVEDIYHQFKGASNEPISQTTNEDFREINADMATFLENVWSIFGKFSAAKLVQMSHEHQPWKDALASEQKTITKEAIYSYYKNVFQRV